MKLLVKETSLQKKLLNDVEAYLILIDPNF